MIPAIRVHTPITIGVTQAGYGFLVVFPFRREGGVFEDCVFFFAGVFLTAKPSSTLHDHFTSVI